MQRTDTHTLKGSFGSDVNVILNVTFDLQEENISEHGEIQSGNRCVHARSCNGVSLKAVVKH